MNVLTKIIFLLMTVAGVIGAPAAFALDYGVNLELVSSSASLCPSNTEHIVATVENTGTLKSTYTLSTNSNWATIVPDKITLNGGEKGDVHIYLTPSNLNADPKTYSIEIKSASTNAADSEIFTLNLLKCHGVGIVTDKTVDTSCLTDRAKFTLDITNYGTLDEVFGITSTGGILSENQISLKAGETKQVYLNVDATKEKETIVVEAQSRTSYAKTTQSVDVLGVNCYDATMQITPDTKTMCIDETSTYTITVQNKGSKDDTYKMATNYGTLSDTDLLVPAGTAKTTKLTVLPKDVGSYDINVKATSLHAEMSSKAKLAAMNCKGIAVLTIPPEMSVCRGTTARYMITMKNIGSRPDTFELTTTMGALAEKRVEIDSGEIKDTYLEIDTKDLDFTTYAFEVAAKSTVEDVAKGTFTVENCYGEDIIIKSETKSVCPGKDTTYELTIRNTGKNDDTYALSAEGVDGSFSQDSANVQAFGEKNIQFTIGTKNDDAGEKRFTITSASEHVTLTKELVAEMQDKETCFGYAISTNPKAIDAEEFKGYLYTATIKNNGLYEEEYVLDVDGPEWASVAPAKLSIAPGESDKAYIYAAPPYGTEAGLYVIRLNAKNTDGVMKGATMQMAIGGAQLSEVPDEDETPADTTTDSSTETVTYIANVNTTESYLLDNASITIVTATYTTNDGLRKSFDIGFETGSFIVHVGDVRIEDENPAVGEKTYDAIVDSTLYRITIEFSEVDKESNMYVFKVKGVDVTENYQENTTATDGMPSGNASLNSVPTKLIYAIAIGIIIILLILFGPEVIELFSRKEEEKKEEKTTFGISGIGPKREAALRKEGIDSVEALSKGDADVVASILGVSAAQAKKYINTAAKKARAKKAEKAEDKKEEKEEPLKEEKLKEPKEEKEKPSKKEKKEESKKDVKDEIKDILDNI